MRRKMVWRAGIVAALTFGGCPDTLIGEPELLGVRPAEAKEYYTRKRVNGRWVTGRFAKRSAAPQRSATERMPEAHPAGSSGIRVSAVEPNIAAVPSASRSETAPPARRPGPQDSRAALAHAPVATSPAHAPLVSAPEAERLDKLRQALQARASALTTGGIEIPRSAPEPQSVSLDFKSGLKTTLFSDGTTVTERFDIGALKGLAATPAEARAGR